MTRTRVSPKDRARPDDERNNDHARVNEENGTGGANDFDAATAFEELRNELVDVEALAAAADAALEGLPFENDPGSRRATGRLYALVAATAASATAALDQADEHLTQLTRGEKPHRSRQRGQ